jgi:Co/Zn/Cd efflux system component
MIRRLFLILRKITYFIFLLFIIFPMLINSLSALADQVDESEPLNIPLYLPD